MPASNVLLLPGMMCDRRMWSAQIDAIDIPVQVADLTTADNFRDMAASVLAAAPARFAMAGLSMGGILAFEIWRQAPERVTHLALLDTNPHPDAEERRPVRFEQIAKARTGRLRELAKDSLKPLYLAECNRNNEALLDTILDMALDLGPDVFERQSIALLDRIDSVPTLATIDCPVLVLCGREDTICPPHYHELMAHEIAGATLVVVNDCGHLSTMERPGPVNAALMRLLAE